MESDYSARVLRSIKGTLDSYGTSVTAVLLWQFRRSTGLTDNDIARKSKEFVDILYKIFGAGATGMVIRISLDLKTNFSLKHLKTEDITEIIDEARRREFKRGFTE